MTDAGEQARAAHAHFLRARSLIADPALMDVVAGFALLASAVESLAARQAEMKQALEFTCEKANRHSSPSADLMTTGQRDHQ
jgi:hypothetical protein